MYQFFNSVWWAYHPNPDLHRTTVNRSTFEYPRVITSITELISQDPLNLTPKQIIDALHDFTCYLVYRSWSSDSVIHNFYFNIKSSVDLIFNCIFLYAGSRNGGIMIRNDHNLIASLLNKVAFKIKRNNLDYYVRLDLSQHNGIQAVYQVYNEEKFNEVYKDKNIIIAETSFEYQSSEHEFFRGDFEIV